MTNQLTPARQSRHTSLFALHPSFYEALHGHLMRPEVSGHWRSRGRLIPTFEFEAFLTRGIARSAVVVDRLADQQILGLVELFDVQQPEGHGQLSIASVVEQPSYFLEGVSLFLDECFVECSLRRIFLHMAPEPATSLRSGLGDLIEIVGALPEYLMVKGTRADVTIGCIERGRFAQFVDQLPFRSILDEEFRVRTLDLGAPT